MIKIAILVDNSFLIHSIQEKLSFFDEIIVIHSSLNGAELLKNLNKNHNIDLILMDIEMCTMDVLKLLDS